MYKQCIVWFQTEFGAFLRPSLIIVDADFELFHAVHALYSEVPKYMSLIDFTRRVWKNAYDMGVLAMDYLNSEVLIGLVNMPKY